MIDELISALEKVQQAKAKYNEASKTCDYDRDYFLRDEIDNINVAIEEFNQLFTHEVKRIVMEVINNKEYLPR